MAEGKAVRVFVIQNVLVIVVADQPSRMMQLILLLWSNRRSVPVRASSVQPSQTRLLPLDPIGLRSALMSKVLTLRMRRSVLTLVLVAVLVLVLANVASVVRLLLPHLPCGLVCCCFR